MKNWLVEWAEKTKEIVLSPSDFYDEVDKKENYGYPIKFIVTSGVIGALLMFFIQEIQVMFVPDVTLPSIMTGLSGLVLILFVSVVGGLVAIFIKSALVHMFAFVFGFQGYRTTFEALSYPTAIGAVLSWIPLVNVFAFFYMIYADIRGIESFHGMDTTKAVACVIFGLLLGVLIFILLVTGLMYLLVFVEPVTGQTFDTTVETIL